MDKNIEQNRQWLEQLLKLMGVPTDVKVDQSYKIEDDPSDWLIVDEKKLSSEQVDILIGFKRR